MRKVASENIQIAAGSGRLAEVYFLTPVPMRPIVDVFRHWCLNEAAVSCRVAEGNGPIEATTTGSGTSLIKVSIPARFAGGHEISVSSCLVPISRMRHLCF